MDKALTAIHCVIEGFVRVARETPAAIAGNLDAYVERVQRERERAKDVRSKSPWNKDESS